MSTSSNSLAKEPQPTAKGPKKKASGPGSADVGRRAGNSWPELLPMQAEDDHAQRQCVSTSDKQAIHMT